MSVYVVTGVSKGIGFEFINQLSADPSNLFIGLVREKATTEQKVATELGSRPNVHIISADLDSYASLKQAAEETAKIVGERGIDYFISNGAYLPLWDGWHNVSALSENPEQAETILNQLNKTNLVGNIYLFNLFLPLVLKGKAKKVVAISSGMADLDLINDTECDIGPLYSANKAALNVLVAKFSALYKKDGVLFFSLSPGVVDVGKGANVSQEELQVLTEFGGKIAKYAPHWKGPITPQESVEKMRAVIDKASIEAGYAGSFISHLGDKQWV